MGRTSRQVWFLSRLVQPKAKLCYQRLVLESEKQIVAPLPPLCSDQQSLESFRKHVTYGGVLSKSVLFEFCLGGVPATPRFAAATGASPNGRPPVQKSPVEGGSYVDIVNGRDKVSDILDTLDGCPKANAILQQVVDIAQT